MVKIRCFDEIIECDRAVKGNDYIYLYDKNCNCPSWSFGGINDFSSYELIEGQWTYPEPTKEELLQAQIDYISMMTGIELEVNDE